VAVRTQAFGAGVRVLGLAQVAAEAAGGAARGLASIPRLVDVLERLADETATLRKIAQSAPALTRLADGIQLIEDALASDDLRAVPKALDSLREATRSLQPLAEAVGELNRAVATLNATVSPLQGTAERLGRLVDRFPARGKREPGGGAIAPPFVAPEIDPHQA
jgi:ABC-type transporter Mla subunit MlaD